MKKDSILISVIVPVYNVEKYLDKCIKSIVNQTYSKLEIILIDDGSKDSSLAICNNWQKRDKRIRVYHQKNMGVSKARNKGLDIAQGDYISFIDSDDIIDERLYETFTEEYNKNIDIIRFRCQTHYGKYRVNSISMQEGEFEFKKDDSLKYDMFFLKHSFGSVCFSIFSKKVIAKTRFDERYKYGEDYLFYFNVLQNCKSIYISNQILYHYLINEFSATRKKDITKELKEIYDHYDVDAYVYNYIINKNLLKYKNDALDCTYNATINWCKNLAKNYSYKEYKNLVNKLTKSDKYQRFKAINQNYKVEEFNSILNKNIYLSYIKFRMTGKIKTWIKKFILKF